MLGFVKINECRACFFRRMAAFMDLWTARMATVSGEVFRGQRAIDVLLFYYQSRLCVIFQLNLSHRVLAPRFRIQKW